jgi:hypothetical protein
MMLAAVTRLPTRLYVRKIDATTAGLQIRTRDFPDGQGRHSAGVQLDRPESKA